MHALIEIVARLAVAADDIFGDVGPQKIACFLEEGLIVVRQLNS
jgi:hypothetical protein